jgi:hypothetical protein
MSYQESLIDKISTSLAPVMRKLNDVTVILMGTRTNLLRITRQIDNFTKKEQDVFGSKKPTWKASLMANVIIKYPYSKVEMWSKIGSDGKFNANVMDLSEILPIELTLQFTGDVNQEPISIVAGDYLVDVLFDENRNKLPMVLEVMRIQGSFFNKELVGKYAEASLVRGALEPEIKVEVDRYVNSLCN